MKRKKKSWFLLKLAGVLWLLFIAAYLLYFRNLVAEAYQGTAPNFVVNFIDWVYPRFSVEKYRFDLSFFLHKADQILLRMTFILVAGWAINYYFIKNKPDFWNRPFKRIQAFSNLILIKRIFYIGLLAYTWDWIFDLLRITNLAEFYKPVLPFRMLHIPLFSADFFVVLYAIFIITTLCVIFNFRAVWCACFNTILFVMMQGYFLSFEKIDHGYASLTYATILMPFLVYEIRKNGAFQDKSLKSWSLPLIQCVIAQIYLIAGLEKVFTGGWTWLSPVTFSTYLRLHETSLGLLIAESDFLCVVLPLAALVFQLSFIFILFFPKQKKWFLLAGILFHTSTVILFNVGGYLSSWIFVYLFFINWDSLIKRMTQLYLPISSFNLSGKPKIKVK